MKCPVDKSDMIVVEHEKIELDHCLKCSGVWFDSGELDLLVGMLKADGSSTSENELLNQQEAKTSEAKRKCPICGRKMDKAWIGNTQRVLIDRCPRGDGLWFDAGELQQVLSQVEPSNTPESRDIITFLGEAFQSTHGRGKGKPDRE